MKTKHKTSTKKTSGKNSSSKQAKKAKQYTIEKILEESEDYGAFLTACYSCKVSEKQLVSYFNDVSNIMSAAKIVHKGSWDLATLDTLAACRCILEKKLGIVEELCREEVISKDSMKLFAYFFLKEGLEYAYPVHAAKKTAAHYDFEYILDTTKRLIDDKT